MFLFWAIGAELIKHGPLISHTLSAKTWKTENCAYAQWNPLKDIYCLNHPEVHNPSVSFTYIDSTSCLFPHILLRHPKQPCVHVDVPPLFPSRRLATLKLTVQITCLQMKAPWSLILIGRPKVKVSPEMLPNFNHHFLCSIVNISWRFRWNPSITFLVFFLTDR